MGVSKNRGTSKSSNFNKVFHCKPSILGYTYFLETSTSKKWKTGLPFQGMWFQTVDRCVFDFYISRGTRYSSSSTSGQFFFGRGWLSFPPRSSWISYGAAINGRIYMGNWGQQTTPLFGVPFHPIHKPNAPCREHINYHISLLFMWPIVPYMAIMGSIWEMMWWGKPTANPYLGGGF